MPNRYTRDNPMRLGTQSAKQSEEVEGEKPAPHPSDIPEANPSGSPVKKIALVCALVLLPIVSGLAWHRASDNPLWPAFRSSLNLCEMSLAQLAPVSPDGRYTAHVVNVGCFGRFNEQMVFVTPTDDGFSAETANPNEAVLEVAGARTIDAVIWQKNPDGDYNRPVLQLVLAKGEMSNLHRIAEKWRNVEIRLGESQPAPGAKQLAY